MFCSVYSEKSLFLIQVAKIVTEGVCLIIQVQLNRKFILVPYNLYTIIYIFNIYYSYLIFILTISFPFFTHFYFWPIFFILSFLTKIFKLFHFLPNLIIFFRKQLRWSKLFEFFEHSKKMKRIDVLIVIIYLFLKKIFISRYELLIK